MCCLVIEVVRSHLLYSTEFRLTLVVAFVITGDPYMCSFGSKHHFYYSIYSKLEALQYSSFYLACCHGILGGAGVLW